ncbi:MAG: prepilin-type N-terminal cleavage/methylation domain-containing protein, partial [Candidatus Omnitrophica bacterium]|nr:prepilin-type N-terminal cleavage/methylation domain-containing protein [Candidatus Omnitrophota bacterium]
MKRSKGFTLIELVMVIVILGILSAIAIPKFVDLASEAK